MSFLFFLSVAIAGPLRAEPPILNIVDPQRVKRFEPVVVADAAHTLASQLVCAEVEPNEMPSQATALAVSDTCTGTAASTDASSVVVTYSDGVRDGIEDLFVVNLAQSARLSLTVSFSNSSADLDLFLFSAAGSTIIPVDNSSTTGSGPETITTNTLAPGLYYVGVSAFMGSSPYSLTGSVVGSGSAPAAPSNLGATVTSSSEVALAWNDNSSDETEFRIETRAGSGSFIDTGSAPANSSAASVRSLLPGTAYTFRVRARNANGYSTYSNEAQATTPNGSSGCSPNATTLCLNLGRFRVQASWETDSGQNGQGQAVALTSDTGYFWFFDRANVEIVVKVLDACGFASRYWVFAGGLTDVRAVMTVTDTQTGSVKTYTNPQKTPFQPIQDTDAFSTCSASCTATVVPATQSFSASAGSGTVTVTTQASCAWTATSNASFLTVTSGASGTGSGSVSYSVAANTTSSSRSGTLTVAGQTVTVTQAGTSSGGGYDGTWTGTTSQGRALNFTVSGGSITSIKIGYSVSGVGCTASGDSTTNYGTPKPITGSTFGWSQTGSGAVSLTFTISGSFGSTTSASGTLSYTIQQTIPGVPSCGGSANVTWTSTKQ